jgi:predicted DNA-binding transcriptional regulator AlpA
MTAHNPRVTAFDRTSRDLPLGQPFLSVPQVATSLGVSIAAVRKWRLQGKLPPAHKHGSRVLYAAKDIESWANQRKERPSSFRL